MGTVHDIKKRFRGFLTTYMSLYKTFDIEIPKEKGIYFSERIKKAILNGEKIFIFGDYDADGLCSVSYKILMIRKAAEALGVKDVFIEYKIPTRAEHYGIKYEQFKGYLDIYDLVITSDNGTHSNFYSKLTEEDHDKLIIVDHHPLIDPMNMTPKQEELLKEFSSRVNVVNPNVDGSVKISTGILDEALFMIMREEIPELKKITESDEFSDLAAITLISDMADKNNKVVRGVIKKGLGRINKRDRAMYQYLFPEFNGVKTKEITAEDIGFQIAPLLNSGPRMSSAVNAIPLLIMQEAFTEKNRRDRTYRSFIDGMDVLTFTNELRKETTDRFTKIADSMMTDFLQESPDANIAVLKIKDSPIGINGLISSNISQKYGIPVIVVSENIFGNVTSSGEMELLGSGRGEGVRQILLFFKGINLESKESINFGGHDMAVGVQIPNWEAFEKELVAFNEKPFEGLSLSTHKVFNEEAITLSEYKDVCDEYSAIVSGIEINDNIFVKIKAFIIGVNEYRNNFKNIILQDASGEQLSIITRPSANLDLLTMNEIEILVSITPGNENTRFADIMTIVESRPDMDLLLKP